LALSVRFTPCAHEHLKVPELSLPKQGPALSPAKISKVGSIKEASNRGPR